MHIHYHHCSHVHTHYRIPFSLTFIAQPQLSPSNKFSLYKSHPVSPLFLLQRSKISVYNRMWEFMSSRKYVFTNSYEEGIERVRTSKGKYAYLLESVKNDYINEQLPCDTMKIGHDLNSNGYGVATPRDSPLK